MPRGFPLAAPACVMLRFARLGLTALMLAASAPRDASALTGVTWEDAEMVASDVSTVGSNSGSVGAFVASLDEWHVVYVRAGEVYHRVRNAGGWQAESNLSNDPADSRDPKVAFASSTLHVVWEDDRSGHPEVWTRRWNGATWTSVECLTDDAVESRAPVLAGGLLAWEEGAVGSTEISARGWSGGAWGGTEIVTASPGSAREPSITSDAAVWTDTRHGQSEIYYRRRQSNGTWDPEVRMTDLPGNCTRPDMHRESCCGDNLFTYWQIVFENDQTGVIETWRTYGGSPNGTPSALSALDGIESARPSLAGHAHITDGGVFGHQGGWIFATWREGGVHRVASYYVSPGSVATTEVFTDVGLDAPTICTTYDQPQAPLLLLWIEDRGTGPELLARRGESLACVERSWTFPPAILLGPEGSPPTVIHGMNTCGGITPLPGSVWMWISSQTDSFLEWDATQTHPNITEPIDEFGDATFALRGGGCTPSGGATIRWQGVTQFFLLGARSPDVDGNCAVTLDDLGYIQARVGTSDFCADLDGSGVVDAADLAIVNATLGDLCSQTTGVEELAESDPGLSVSPNPFTDATHIALRGASEGVASIRIVDAGGRLVRSDSEWTVRAPVATWTWDGRDDSGHAVSSGIYFAVVTREGQRLSRSLLLLRR